MLSDTDYLWLGFGVVVAGFLWLMLRGRGSQQATGVEPGTTVIVQAHDIGISDCLGCGSIATMARPHTAGMLGNTPVLRQVDRLHSMPIRYELARYSEDNAPLEFCLRCYRRACNGLEDVYGRFRNQNAELRSAQQTELAAFEQGLGAFVARQVQEAEAEIQKMRPNVVVPSQAQSMPLLVAANVVQGGRSEETN